MATTLNHISTIVGSSSYLENHLVVLIDGKPLDELLDARVPSHQLMGLVPTLLGCHSEAEASVVNERILPKPGTPTVAPVLMCPDDADFSCTLVVVEVVSSDDEVEWRRIGMDETPWDPDPSHIGRRVEWFKGVDPFRFGRTEYLDVLKAFEPSPQLAGRTLP